LAWGIKGRFQDLSGFFIDFIRFKKQQCQTFFFCLQKQKKQMQKLQHCAKKIISQTNKKFTAAYP
jgi:hypothetical protein